MAKSSGAPRALLPSIAGEAGGGASGRRAPGLPRPNSSDGVREGGGGGALLDGCESGEGGGHSAREEFYGERRAELGGAAQGGRQSWR